MSAEADLKKKLSIMLTLAITNRRCPPHSEWPCRHTASCRLCWEEFLNNVAAGNLEVDSVGGVSHA